MNDREISLVQKKKITVLEGLLAEITLENRQAKIHFGIEGNELT